MRGLSWAVRHAARHALIFVAIVEPSRNVAARINHAPYIDMVVSFDIEGKPRKAGKPAMLQTRQVQLMRVARRANAGMLLDRAGGRFERFDEAQRPVRPQTP